MRSSGGSLCAATARGQQALERCAIRRRPGATEGSPRTPDLLPGRGGRFSEKPFGLLRKPVTLVCIGGVHECLARPLRRGMFDPVILVQIAGDKVRKLRIGLCRVLMP